MKIRFSFRKCDQRKMLERFLFPVSVKPHLALLEIEPQDDTMILNPHAASRRELLLASAETRQTINRAESRPQALALLFMAPEFQRR